jgi:hypothetical protein
MDVIEADFRAIRLGDLNLLSSIGADNIVRYNWSPGSGRGLLSRVVVDTRRIYRARNFSSQSDFTAAVYEGEDSAQVRVWHTFRTI